MRLCERATQDPNLMRVEALAAEAGVNVRAVQRLFRQHVCAPPKFVIRRARLQEAARAIEREPTGVSLAELAARLGYADQAHMSRDFNSVTGRTPRAFARSVG